MILRRLASVLLVTALLTACGDSGTEPDSFEQVSGSYNGVMAAVSQGVALDGTFSLTLTQDGGELGGSYGVSGTLTDGVSVVDVQGTGTLDGSIEAGRNPSVNITVVPGVCPSQTSTFSGTYDSPNRRLTLIGAVEIFSDACQVVVAFPSTLVLTR